MAGRQEVLVLINNYKIAFLKLQKLFAVEIARTFWERRHCVPDTEHISL